MAYGRRRVTAANAPLWQGRQRTSAEREMMDAYYGAPTFADANMGELLRMKGRAYRAKLSIAYQKKRGLGPYAPGRLFGSGPLVGRRRGYGRRRR
ncbi:hypothetical protein LCGC14_0814240 [marine sediment metagenome]|uniref:Uncharacterized protein n=1 Tax=marine sediment metagenome TaxID=412755 RepID=A0A0F9S5Q1_9ZZZZ